MEIEIMYFRQKNTIMFNLPTSDLFFPLCGQLTKSILVVNERNVFQKSPMNETCYRSESNNVEVEAGNQKKRDV